MNNIEQFQTPSASYTLKRLPEIENDTLRAWDAADELLVNTVFSDYADNLNEAASQPLLIVNDNFGALNLAFHKYSLDNWSDSFVSHLAAQQNLSINDIEKTDSMNFVASTDELKGCYKLVIIKIPKTLSLLEDQLYKLKPYINKDTKIIAAAMTKNIHNSTLALFEKIIGTTTTSRATKKARLIFAENNTETTESSPYPNIITEEKRQLTLFNHANVFSKDKLDVGTRFLIQNMDQCPKAEHIIDIGCGNGALGIIAKRHQPTAKISFVDESYNAVASAKQSYNNAYPESASDASFHISNALEQFTEQDADNKAQLVLCNPPFHQVHSIGDQIAWAMFTQSREALDTGGEMWIVGNRHLGYHIKLKKVFGNCRTIATNPKFVILAAT
ncbi:MAG: methyltransferase, partial [Cocleimonas sp.]